MDLCFLMREDDVGSDVDIARITRTRHIVSLQQEHGGRAVLLPGR
jgi:hypothetical protein